MTSHVSSSSTVNPEPRPGLASIRIAAMLMAASFCWLLSPPAADAQGATPTYVWKQGDNRISMGPTKEWFCGIRSIQGSFKGKGEKVEVSVNAQNEWYIDGQSQQRDVQIEAFCFPHNSAASGLKTYSWAQGDNPVKMGSDREYFCALASVSGQFEGEKEVVEVNTVNGDWQLSGGSFKKDVAATAACVKFNTSKMSSTDWKQGETPKTLTSAARSICYLSRMAGKFDGIQERIALSIVKGNWQLGGGSFQKDVAATATCLTF